MASAKHLPHDRFMRQNFERIPWARAYFEQNLPRALRSLVDLQTLALHPQSFVSDDLRLQTADVLFSVQTTRPQKRHTKAYMYILVEHLSTPDPMLAFRILKYMVAIWDHHLTKSLPRQRVPLPLILPFVLYTGRRKFTHSTAFFDLFDGDKGLAQELLSHPFALKDLSQTPDAELEGYALAQPALLMAKHIYALRHGDRALLEKLVAKVVLIEKKGEMDYAKDILVYAMLAGRIPDKKLLVDVIETAFEGDSAMNLLKEFEKDGIKKGRELGLQEGLEKGLEEGLERVALNLLEKGVSLEFIQDTTGLTVPHILSLRTLH